MNTCLFCNGTNEGRGPGGIQHTDDCPVLAGGVWECSCVGPYCDDEYCDGRLVMPGSSTVLPPGAAKKQAISDHTR